MLRFRASGVGISLSMSVHFRCVYTKMWFPLRVSQACRRFRQRHGAYMPSASMLSFLACGDIQAGIPAPSTEGPHWSFLFPVVRQANKNRWLVWLPAQWHSLFLHSRPAGSVKHCEWHRVGSARVADGFRGLATGCAVRGKPMKKLRQCCLSRWHSVGERQKGAYCVEDSSGEVSDARLPSLQWCHVSVEW